MARQVCMCMSEKLLLKSSMVSTLGEWQHMLACLVQKLKFSPFFIGKDIFMLWNVIFHK